MTGKRHLAAVLRKRAAIDQAGERVSKDRCGDRAPASQLFARHPATQWLSSVIGAQGRDDALDDCFPARAIEPVVASQVNGLVVRQGAQRSSELIHRKRETGRELRLGQSGRMLGELEPDGGRGVGILPGREIRQHGGISTAVPLWHDVEDDSAGNSFGRTGDPKDETIAVERNNRIRRK